MVREEAAGVDGDVACQEEQQNLLLLRSPLQPAVDGKGLLLLQPQLPFDAEESIPFHGRSEADGDSPAAPGGGGGGRGGGGGGGPDLSTLSHLQPEEDESCLPSSKCRDLNGTTRRPSHLLPPLRTQLIEPPRVDLLLLRGLVEDGEEAERAEGQLVRQLNSQLGTGNLHLLGGNLNAHDRFMSLGDAAGAPDAELGRRREETDEEDLVARRLVRKPEVAEQEDEARDPVASFTLEAPSQHHSVLASLESYCSVAAETRGISLPAPAEHREHHGAAGENYVRAVQVFEQHARWSVDVWKEQRGGGKRCRGGGGRRVAKLSALPVRMMLILYHVHHRVHLVDRERVDRRAGNLDVQVELLSQCHFEQHRLLTLLPRCLTKPMTTFLLRLLLPHPLARHYQPIPQVQRDDVVQLLALT
mmetsp:Transcript_48547/g.152260  ORF Transcript_48547/g.152260 Transcript_48547/m.152260 type:complete len:416 (+) Transcript_48547:229-1476(+)